MYGRRRVRGFVLMLEAQLAGLFRRLGQPLADSLLFDVACA